MAMIPSQTPLRRFSSHAFPSPSPAHPTHFSSPTAAHLLALLNHCSTPGQLHQTHAFMVTRGLDQDNHFLTRFLETCSRLGHTSYVHSVFARKDNPDLFLCNTVISALSQTDMAMEAIGLYRRVRVMGLQPNSYSFPSVLKAVAHLGLLNLGREVHGQVVRAGLFSDAYVGTGLVRMYSACGEVPDARRVFDGLSLRHVMFWNAVLAAYAKVGDTGSARELFEVMPERNLVSWTTMIAAYSQGKQSADAIEIFWRMQSEDNILPDEVALLAALTACADLGALELGEWIHRYIDKRNLCKTVPLMNSLVDMYAKSGDIRKSLDVFESMQCRSVVSWSTMIAGLALHGLGAEAFEMFHRMEEAMVKPNEVVFLAILSACSHSGLVDMGRWYFDCLSSRYLIKPRIEHYGCMIDLLGRAGNLKEARDLVERMPYKPNAAIFGSLLSAANVHGNVELGEYALRNLIEVEPYNCGNYSLLSNLYASNGKWSAAGNVRKLMRNSGVKKVPGGSSIELNGTVYEFTARDRSHPQSLGIYEVLHKLNKKLQIIEHVPGLCS